MENPPAFGSLPDDATERILSAVISSSKKPPAFVKTNDELGADLAEAEIIYSLLHADQSKSTARQVSKNLEAFRTAIWKAREKTKFILSDDASLEAIEQMLGQYRQAIEGDFDRSNNDIATLKGELRRGEISLIVFNKRQRDINAADDFRMRRYQLVDGGIRPTIGTLLNAIDALLDSFAYGFASATQEETKAVRWLVQEKLTDLFNKHFCRKATYRRDGGTPAGPAIAFIQQSLIEMKAYQLASRKHDRLSSSIPTLAPTGIAEYLDAYRSTKVREAPTK